MSFAKKLTITALALWYLGASVTAGYASGNIQNSTYIGDTVDEGTKIPDDTLYSLINGLDYLKFIELVDNNQYSGVADQYKNKLKSICQYDMSSLSNEDRHKVAQVNNSLGTIYSRQKQYKKALGFFLKAVALDGTFSAFYRNIGKTYKELGKQTGEKEYFEYAIEAYQNCLELEPEGSNRAIRVQRAIDSIQHKYLPQLTMK